MYKQFNYYWRLIATAISFSLFGIGGLLISLLAVPVALLLPNSLREIFAKRIIHYTFRLFVNVMWFLGVLSYSSEGIEKLRRAGQLVVANHPTLVDIVFLIAMMPKADCIVKSSLLANPFMRGSIMFAGYIANDDPEQVIALAEASLARGNSLVIFPEGTRSRRQQKLHFMRGAANIAVRTKSNLCPVVLDCKPITLGKGEKWYQIPESRFHYRMQVQDTLTIAPYLRGEPSHAARELTQHLQDYFARESKWYESTGA